MTPFSFEELQKILELKPDEIDIDLLIFNSALFYVENLLGYQLADKNYNELQTVKDCMVYTEQSNITEMINIIDMTTKLRVPHCVIDGRRILFIDTKLEGHVVFLNYNSGFLPETFPADLKEAIIKIFLLKKKDFIKHVNHEDDSAFEIPQDIQSVISLYRKKMLMKSFETAYNELEYLFIHKVPEYIEKINKEYNDGIILKEFSNKKLNEECLKHPGFKFLIENAEYDEKDRIIENTIFDVSFEIKLTPDTERKINIFWRYIEVIRRMIDETESEWLYQITEIKENTLFIRVKDY